MAAGRNADPAMTRAAVSAIAHWLRDEALPAPERRDLAEAVRLTARTLAALAPGASVEVRVPPYVAVQCVPGPGHRRGTPPNVVETDARTWLLLVTGLMTIDDAVDTGALQLSGARAGQIAAAPARPRVADYVVLALVAVVCGVGGYLEAATFLKTT